MTDESARRKLHGQDPRHMITDNNSQQQQANASQQFPMTEAEEAGRRQEVNVDANAGDEDNNARIQESGNQLHRLRDALRRRLGQDAIRTDA